MKLVLMSFGWKWGRPEASHVFDVSFLKNPKRANKHNTDEEIKDYLLAQPETLKFLDLVELYIRYIHTLNESIQVVGFGCTGGLHRSYMMTKLMAERLKDLGPIVVHKDKVKFE